VVLETPVVEVAVPLDLAVTEMQERPALLMEEREVLEEPVLVVLVVPATTVVSLLVTAALEGNMTLFLGMAPAAVVVVVSTLT